MNHPFSRLLPPDGRVAVMGIVNVTPDSFSDGGKFYSSSGLHSSELLQSAERMAVEGVDIFDVGGESTRPGALAVTTAEELARVVPVVKLLKQHFSIPVSVDTSNPEVMRAVCDEGADMINDVRSFSRPGALAEAARTRLPVCIMHMPAEPGVMQDNPCYTDVVREVGGYLRLRAQQCIDAGIAKENIFVDPGFGFGKNLQHNLTLFRALPVLAQGEFPLFVGVSRKRMVGEITGKKEAARRVSGSVALALLAVRMGAKIIRVHDVAETLDAMKILYAVEGSSF